MYPAWYALHEDIALRRYPTAISTYAMLTRIQTIFYEPHHVKAWALAEKLGASEKAVNRALDLLIARGYAIELERGLHNVRRLMLVRCREAPASTSHDSAA